MHSSTKFCPPDVRNIGFSDQREINFWMAKFDISEHTLRNVVQVVGPSVKKVRERLKERKMPAPSGASYH